MTTAPKTETDSPFCPHCGTESTDDDDLCRFCGKVMVAPVAQEGGCAHALLTGIRALKSHIRPMTADELEDQEKSLAIFDPANPANPIWDD